MINQIGEKFLNLTQKITISNGRLKKYVTTSYCTVHMELAQSKKKKRKKILKSGK